MKPNIIFILTDDQRYDTMGFMGNTQVHTPNLDALAREGVAFSNAFHISPLCMPSRACIQLGKYVSQHHCGFDAPTNFTVSDEEYQESYPALLRKNGYYTGFIGKFGFPVYKDKIPNAKYKIDPKSSPEDPYYARYDLVEFYKDALPEAEFDEWMGFCAQGSYRPDPKTGMFNGYENTCHAEHLIDFNTWQAQQFLRHAKNTGKPFSLSISYKAPHRPHDAQKKWFDYYDKMTIRRMKNDAPEYFAKLPEVVRTHSRNASEYWGTAVAGYRPSVGCKAPWSDEAVFQRDFKNYYGLISGVDESVGEIRKTLKQLGMDHNTVLIYTSDNGYFCGSKQLGGKELLYEESIRAPMIVYDPRMPEEKQGKMIEGMISILDLCPTILDYAGIPKTASMDGHSFIPLITGEKQEINDAVYGEDDFNFWYAVPKDYPDPAHYRSLHCKYVRTKKFKYIRYLCTNPVVEEMWEIDKDPLETHNLAEDPAYQEQLDTMRKMLDGFMSHYQSPVFPRVRTE